MLERARGSGPPRPGHQLEAGRDAVVELAPADLGRSARIRARGRTAPTAARRRRPRRRCEWCILATTAICRPRVPRRSTSPTAAGPVELVAGDVAGEVGQLAQPAGRGHRGPAHVVVDVEARGRRPTPGGPGGTAPRPAGAGTPGRSGMRSTIGLPDPLEGVARRAPSTGRAPRHGHVHVEGRRLEVEEAGVESAQSFRGHVSPRARSRPGKPSRRSSVAPWRTRWPTTRGRPVGRRPRRPSRGR